MMKLPALTRSVPVLSAFALAMAWTSAYAAEHITLRNGSEFDCIRQEPAGDRVRLYLIPVAVRSTSDSSDPGYIEVAAASVLRVETIPDPPAPPAPRAVASAPHPTPEMRAQNPTPLGIQQLLTSAGTKHNIDADLLASIVHAESDGNPRAVSRAGARGLMQLMPGTAALLGVTNSFAPDQNISGGSTYFDQLLTRYHDDIRLAVAAYNAGPAAVDRYHGIPPFAETRAYVARVVREFNRRKLAALTIKTAN